MDVESNLAALAQLQRVQQAAKQQQGQGLQQEQQIKQPPAAAPPLQQVQQMQPPLRAQQPAPAVPQPAAALPQPAAALPQPTAALLQQAQQAGAPAGPASPEPPVDSLGLQDLRQAFFDQPSELPALRARLAELEDLRKQCVFPDGGALWDGLLARLRRYLLLLEREEQAAAAAAAEQQAGAAEGGAPPAAPPARAPFAPRCDLCGRAQQAAGPPSQLRRMQLMGARRHLAVCGACAEARRGTLIPLTPTWQLDPVGAAACSSRMPGWHGFGWCARAGLLQ